MFEAKGVKDHVMESLTYDEYGGLRRKADGTLYTEEEKRRIAAEATEERSEPPCFRRVLQDID